MKRTRTIKINDNLKVLLENSGFIILSVTFAIAFLIGSLFVFKNINLQNFITLEFETFFNIRKTGNFGAKFANSLLFVLPSALLSFVCGTSVVGCVLSPIFLMYKAFILGSYAGYIYEVYALEGIIFNALVLIPSAVVSAFALLLSVRESIAFSVALSQLCIKGRKSINIFFDFKSYCYKHLVILCLALFAVILDLGCSSLFIKFFNFWLKEY